MNYILIIFLLFIVLIGVAYYYDFKKNKRYFKKSIRDILSLIVIVLGVYILSELGNKVLEYFYK
ncbi:MAG: hypothetical protein REI96_04030 [Flavobacterium nitrogenifigens]|uniref:Uncharacterized protein n=1 Tax=Flavobacterium nitrogenifigens TaxID=1617283 RepID=A0A521EX19_9FLAO|nr:hypothetical protein [Flavobacterium nitrogenifigens]KAF2333312.1 hypothetical protein DM397_09185 [Flavobacterium nitrogenifigens]MDQ8011593.1 hypothetical protein [Flavobacterium nitrogenifigens]SMO88457.1 hypothetical protein SAMN06265220_105216 [Flavobacterium nitrogenifigens]